RDSSLFLDLLRRKNLDNRTRLASLQKLTKAGSDWPNEVKVLSKKDDDALKEYVGAPAEGIIDWVPCYGSYKTFRRSMDGEDVSTMEWVMAGAEPALLLASLASTGNPGAGKAVSVSVGSAGKKVAAAQVANRLRSHATKLALRKLKQQAAAQAVQTSQEQTIRWGVSQLLSEMQTKARAFYTTIDKATTIDITNATRYAYSQSHVGRGTFKTLTGLDARLFMQRDARVHLRLMHKDTLETVK